MINFIRNNIDFWVFCFMYFRNIKKRKKKRSKNLCRELKEIVLPVTKQDNPIRVSFRRLIS